MDQVGYEVEWEVAVTRTNSNLLMNICACHQQMKDHRRWGSDDIATVIATERDVMIADALSRDLGGV